MAATAGAGARIVFGLDPAGAGASTESRNRRVENDDGASSGGSGSPSALADEAVENITTLKLAARMAGERRS